MKQGVAKSLTHSADLQTNPGKLPQRIGPGEALRDTVRGHETLLNRQMSRLKELEDQYDKECLC